MLTETKIKAAKPRDKTYKLADGGGLTLLVRPNGSKLWRFRYRFHGIENMLSVGTFPHVGLALARDRRDDARKLLARGIDPSAERAEAKVRQRQLPSKTSRASGCKSKSSLR